MYYAISFIYTHHVYLDNWLRAFSTTVLALGVLSVLFEVLKHKLYKDAPGNKEKMHAPQSFLRVASIEMTHD